MKRAAANSGGISSAAVKKATGRTWPQWLAILDRAGARKMPHRQIAAHLRRQHRMSDWWSQILTVGYEQARRLRAKPPESDGFAVSVTKTIAAPVDRAFAAWRDAALREQWLSRTPLTVRKATPHKSIRIVWADQTLVSVNFWPKGPLKCQIVPEHGCLATPEAAEKMKAYWAEKLEQLRAFLEK